LAASLPGDIDAIVQQIRAGKVGVDFRVHDPEGAVDHLVDGLVAAASVLASAQLISRGTGPRIGSISIPGLITAGVGVLTWQRLVRRRQEHETWVSRAREIGALRHRGEPASPR
jgi:ubiquinone biosynthesis protein